MRRAAQRLVFVGLGAVLALMNSLFYLAVERLPLSTVGAVEFLGIVMLAALGARTRRNIAALMIAVTGVAVLTNVRLSGEPWGFVFAFANCLCFVAYVILGHRIASTAGPTRAGVKPARVSMSGIDQLGLSMLIAAVVATPFTVGSRRAGLHPSRLAGLGDRRRHLLVGHPVRDGSVGDGPAAPGHLRPDAVPAAGRGDHHRFARAPAGADRVRHLGVALVIAGVALHHD